MCVHDRQGLNASTAIERIRNLFDLNDFSFDDSVTLKSVRNYFI